MPKTMKPAIIFDLDGTLVDTAPDLAASTNHVMVQLGRRTLTIEELRNCVGRGARHLIARGLEITGGATDSLIDTGHPLFLDHYRNNLTTISVPFPGVIDTLRHLAGRGYPMAVCTNKPEDLALPIIQQLGLHPFFTAVIGGATAGKAKPDPAPLIMALESTDSTSGWMIGDSYIDIDAAKNAGWPSVAVRYGYGPGTADTLGASHVIDRFPDLLDLFA